MRESGDNSNAFMEIFIVDCWSRNQRLSCGRLRADLIGPMFNCKANTIVKYSCRRKVIQGVKEGASYGINAKGDNRQSLIEE